MNPRSINPLVIHVMAEEGFDLADAQSDEIVAFVREGKLYECVIYV